VDVSGNLNTRTIGFPLGNVLVQNRQITDWLQLGGDIDGQAVTDYSGGSVALSADGSIVAIGATGNDGTVSASDFGHVRVYQRNITNTTVAPIGWTQLGGDIVGEATSDGSGYSLSLSADGLTVAIGANLNDGTTGANRGHVRVYKYRSTKVTADTNETNSTFGPVGWDRLGKDIDGEAVDDQSGYSVSLSADGSTVAISSGFNDGTNPSTVGDNRGHVRVYNYVFPNWTQLGGDIDGEAALDNSGWSVALSSNGSIVAIGGYKNDGTATSTTDNRGHVRVYKYGLVQANAWSQLGTDIDGEAANDQYGISVSLSADGTIVAIGANQNDGTATNTGDNRGHVRVFKYGLVQANTWSQLGSDIDGEAASDQSGVSVSLSADGTIVAIGARSNDGTATSTTDDRGHVRVYKYDSLNWTQLGTDIDGEVAGDQSGLKISLSSDGFTLAVGVTTNDGTTTNPNDNRGHVRVFKYLPSGLYSNAPLIVTNAITTGDVTLYDNFNVTRATSLAGTLSVAGASTVSTVNTSSNASVGGALTVSGATTSVGALNVSGATTSTTMTLSSNAVIGGTLVVSGAATMQTLNLTGPIKKI
jgi:hypothetical protein